VDRTRSQDRLSRLGFYTIERKRIEMALPSVAIQGNIGGNAIEPSLRIGHAWQFGPRREGAQKGLLQEVFGQRAIASHAVEIIQQRAVVVCEQLLKGGLFLN
jgi:hypothetical protein